MNEPVIRTAREDDQGGLTALWATAFTPPLAPDQWLLDDQRLARTLVAEDDEGLCGSIHGMPKGLREDDGIAEVLAIGSVAVAERARGRGLARRLVAAALERAGRAEWALLFTGTPEVYRSSGFEAFSMARILVGPWRAPASSPDAGRVVRETVGAGSLETVREAYELSREGRVVLAPVRGDRDWSMAEARLNGATLYRAIEDDRTVAYAVARISGDVGLLLECAMVPGIYHAEDRWHELLGPLAADWAAAGVASCEAAIPALPEEEHAIRAFAPEARRQEDRTGMIRPIRRAARVHGIRHLTEADYF